MTSDDVKRHVDRFFSDTSRSPAETKSGLEDVLDHINTLIESIPAEDDDEEGT